MLVTSKICGRWELQRRDVLDHGGRVMTRYACPWNFEVWSERFIPSLHPLIHASVQFSWQKLSRTNSKCFLSPIRGWSCTVMPNLRLRYDITTTKIWIGNLRFFVVLRTQVHRISDPRVSQQGGLSPPPCFEYFTFYSVGATQEALTGS